jgi:hypothetical protein
MHSQRTGQEIEEICAAKVEEIQILSIELYREFLYQLDAFLKTSVKNSRKKSL